MNTGVTDFELSPNGKEIAFVFRGEVFVSGVKYLVNETAYELIDDCKKTWKIPATLKESCYQSFSCETDPCSPLPETCCDPEGIEATVEFTDESGVTCCDPEIISKHRKRLR